MRRRECLPAQRACSLVAVWTAAHTRGYRHLTTPAPAVNCAATIPAKTAPGNASAPGEGGDGGGSTTATTGTAIRTPSVTAAVESPGKGNMDGNLKKALSTIITSTTAATAAAAATDDEAVAAATERLRAALRVFSVIEQAKSDERKLNLSNLMEEVSPIDVEPDGDESPLPEHTDGLKGFTTTMPPPSAADVATAGGSSGSDRRRNTTAAPLASSISWASATSSWIRNKRPKFWAIVNDAGVESCVAVSGQETAAAVVNEKARSAAELAASAAGTPGKAEPKSSEAASTSASPSLASSPVKTANNAALPSSSGEDAASRVLSSSREGTDAAARQAAPASAQSVRTASSVPPFRSRYKKDVAHALSELLSRDPALGPQLLSQLSAESRRLLLIMGTASEYFGVDYGEVAEQIKEADTDRDNSISSKEFDAWVNHMAGMASTRRHRAPATAESGKEAASPSTDSSRSPLTSAAPAASLAKAAPGATSTPAKGNQSTQVSTPVSSASEKPVAAQTPAVPSKAAAVPPLPPPLQSEANVYVTTLVGGLSPHLVAPSATLSRQRAEMAIVAARAASARIIEVLQKNVTALPSSASAAAAAAVAATATITVGKGDSATQSSSTSSPPSAPSPGLQRQPPPVQPSSPSVSAQVATSAPSASTGLVAAKPPSTGAQAIEYVPSTKCADAPPANTAFVNATTTCTAAGEVPKAVKRGDPAYIPWPIFAKVVCAAAPPFLAFGMLDNCTLVLAGGAIDNIFSVKLGLSQMAAASLGGVVSGVAGIQVHGLAERFTRAKPPQLTAAQAHSDAYRRAETTGNTLGMVVGLVIGMTPLLFVGRASQDTEEEAEEERQRFHEEAARSHQRRCRSVEKAETLVRHAHVADEHTAREEIATAYAATPAPSAP
ncbi:hypothetical protein ABB37_09000 [Leptomonas pyrrhocoris]|uniref:EF-hand domain-containing protein n=1 Tax=Leptomonas pyrrhocoris TaxID=157538 RepID=A0A0N0DRM4_LEPPY|nr:hypothetical protein ABB37_09000 [Leptomonas pyrrhocoris]XP_015653111.1 hypothetical protein ABB37_09000 [Leptomonas pyrrhocoris]KPA74671.1 hypothetical protein ABB37_09000 [Leptomonas pyrrhocoris]KPA74672.1 hypothetical protein ABB37_09000 [Leptomonas pyrrhocoris]|eukprot:XP_015653110.1 hypothetical protein ABB37_09000 [Leptomonas pyrrhocoris]